MGCTVVRYAENSVTLSAVSSMFCLLFGLCFTDQNIDEALSSKMSRTPLFKVHFLVNNFGEQGPAFRNQGEVGKSRASCIKPANWRASSATVQNLLAPGATTPSSTHKQSNCRAKEPSFPKFNPATEGRNILEPFFGFLEPNCLANEGGICTTGAN